MSLSNPIMASVSHSEFNLCYEPHCFALMNQIQEVKQNFLESNNINVHDKIAYQVKKVTSPLIFFSAALTSCLFLLAAWHFPCLEGIEMCSFWGWIFFCYHDSRKNHLCMRREWQSQSVRVCRDTSVSLKGQRWCFWHSNVTLCHLEGLFTYMNTGAFWSVCDGISDFSRVKPWTPCLIHWRSPPWHSLITWVFNFTSLWDLWVIIHCLRSAAGGCHQSCLTWPSCVLISCIWCSSHPSAH